MIIEVNGSTDNDKEETVMKYTSAEASKLLRTLSEEHSDLAGRERSLDTFGAFAGGRLGFYPAGL